MRYLIQNIDLSLKYNILLVTILFIIPCCVFAETKPNTITLQLKWKHQFQFAGYYIAKEKGYYDDLNIQVRIIEGSDNCNPVDSVMFKKAQMGIGGSELLIERNNGKPLVALLSIYQHSPLVLISKKTNELLNIHDVVGKHVMIENHASELYAYLKDEGIDYQSLIIHPYKANISLLINDTVDFISAYITDEPFLLKERNIQFQFFSPNSVGIDFYSDILFTSEDFIKQNKDAVDAFIEATKRGWDYALNHIEETADIIYQRYSKRKKIDHLIYEAYESKKIIKNDVIEIGYMYEGRWQHIGETYVKLGMLRSDFSLNKFIYSKNKNKSFFGLIYTSLAGVLMLVFIILLILLSYFIYMLLDKLRTNKTKRNRNVSTNR